MGLTQRLKKWGPTRWLLERPLVVKHPEMVKFTLVGLTNTAVDFILYGLLANVFGIWPVVANIMSVGFCMIMSFLLNMNFVWRTEKSIRETAPKFFAITIFTGWGVQSVVVGTMTGLMSGWLSFMGEGLLNMFAKLCAGLIGMMVNFVGYRFIFRSK